MLEKEKTELLPITKNGKGSKAVLANLNIENIDDFLETEEQSKKKLVAKESETASSGQDSLLSKRLSEFGISNRLAKGLEFDNIVYVGDLVHKTERDMLRIPNFGVTTLSEVKKLLAPLNLQLGMDFPNWSPEGF